MSNWLKVDASSSDAYVKYTFPTPFTLGNGFTMEADIWVPSATQAAVIAAYGGTPAFSADFFKPYQTTSDFGGWFDGVGYKFTTPSVTEVLTDFSPSSGGSVTLDSSQHVTYTAVWNSGSSQYDVTVKLNGTTILTFSQGGWSPTDTFNHLILGAKDAAGGTSEIYYLTNFSFKNSVGTTIFSDNFGSGDLSAWTSTVHPAQLSVQIGDPPGGGPTVDFSLSASAPTVTFSFPATLTSTITVGEITSPEVVNLSLDTSGLPVGITASLDVATGTTPYDAILSIVAEPGLPCNSYNIIVTGDDGTNTHSITVVVDLSGTVETYDTVTSPSQAGSSMSQSGNDIDIYEGYEGDLFVFDGVLYWAWCEVGNYGPYIAYWNGTDWTLFASLFEPNDGTIRVASPKFATDGTNLYFAYLAQRPSTWTDCRDPTHVANINATPFFVQVWKYDGASWTYLGETGGNGVLNDADLSDASTNMDISASPDEVGACYVAFFEEGYEGPNAATYWASRHLQIVGFGTSSYFQSLSSFLYEPSRPLDGFGRCDGSPDFAAQFFSFRLVGSGANLTLYTEALDFDQLTMPYWTKIQIWRKTGFLPDVVLSTEFPDPGVGSLVGYTPALTVSEELDGKRYIGVTLEDSFNGTIVVVKQIDVTAPATFNHVWGIPDGSADSIFTAIDRIIPEDSNHLWAFSMKNDPVELLEKRCKFTLWENPGANFSSSFKPYQGDPIIFQDKVWAVGGVGVPRVYKLPICRNCGTCCSLACPPSIIRFYVGGEWRQKNVDTAYTVWHVKDGVWMHDCDSVHGFLEADWRT